MSTEQADQAKARCLAVVAALDQRQYFAPQKTPWLAISMALDRDPVLEHLRWRAREKRFEVAASLALSKAFPLRPAPAPAVRKSLSARVVRFFIRPWRS